MTISLVTSKPLDAMQLWASIQMVCEWATAERRAEVPSCLCREVRADESTCMKQVRMGASADLALRHQREEAMKKEASWSIGRLLGAMRARSMISRESEDSE